MTKHSYGRWRGCVKVTTLLLAWRILIPNKTYVQLESEFSKGCGQLSGSAITHDGDGFVHDWVWLTVPDSHRRRLMRTIQDFCSQIGATLVYHPPTLADPNPINDGQPLVTFKERRIIRAMSVPPPHRDLFIQRFGQAFPSQWGVSLQVVDERDDSCRIRVEVPEAMQSLLARLVLRFCRDVGAELVL